MCFKSSCTFETLWSEPQKPPVSPRLSFSRHLKMATSENAALLCSRLPLRQGNSGASTQNVKSPESRQIAEGRARGEWGRHQAGRSNGIIPLRLRHAITPSQGNKKTRLNRQNDIQLQRREKQWQEAAEAAARYRVCLPPLPFGEGKNSQQKNKTKQAKQNGGERGSSQIASRPTRR